jgi:XTP/dITP diphosphohydrolase
VPEELDIASLGAISEEEWRAFWPSAETVEDVEAVEPVEDVDDDEPVVAESESEPEDVTS